MDSIRRNSYDNPLRINAGGVVKHGALFAELPPWDGFVAAGLSRRPSRSVSTTHPIRLCGLVASLVLTGSILGGPVPRSVASPTSQPKTPNLPAPIDPSAPPLAEGERARVLNAMAPEAAGPVARAASFVLPTNGESAGQALECLTAAVYYEAASEPTDGQRAVAQVVLNRLRHPAFPRSVCGVVFQGSERRTGCQFSFTCDGSLARRPSLRGLARARDVARAALAGYVYAPVGLSTHYHADYVFPYWAPTLVKIRQIGAHIFYRWGGGWGRPSAFRAAYVANEQYPRIGIANVAPLDQGVEAGDVVAAPAVAVPRFEPQPGSPIGRVIAPEAQAAGIGGLRPLRLVRNGDEATASRCTATGGASGSCSADAGASPALETLRR